MRLIAGIGSSRYVNGSFQIEDERNHKVLRLNNIDNINAFCSSAYSHELENGPSHTNDPIVQESAV